MRQARGQLPQRGETFRTANLSHRGLEFDGGFLELACFLAAGLGKLIYQEANHN